MGVWVFFKGSVGGLWVYFKCSVGFLQGNVGFLQKKCRWGVRVRMFSSRGEPFLKTEIFNL